MALARPVLLAAAAVFGLLIAAGGNAHALPFHGFDGGQEFGFFEKHDKSPDRHFKPDGGFKDEDHNWYHAGKHDGYHPGKHGDDPKKWQTDYAWNDHKGWGQDFHWRKPDNDPDCDPPVSSPEPTTLLMLGSTLAGVVAAGRRRLRK